MALSDSCFDFLHAVEVAAEELAKDVHRYAAPGNPLRYGEEIEGLRRACAKVADSPYDPEAGAQLLRLAVSVMRYLDTPPGVSELPERQAEMKALIQLIQSDLNAEDASAVPAIIQTIATETPFTERAAEHLKVLLPKLGKASYDVAVKVISDIASATAKKVLGL